MTHRLAQVMLVLWFVFATVAARPASLALVATTPTSGVNTGDIVSFEIVMDFRFNPTLGGGFDIVFDPTAIAFVSFYRDPSIGVPEFSSDPDIQVGLLENWFVFDFAGLPTTATLGSVVFEILPGMGESTFVSTQRTSVNGGNWASGINLGDPIPNIQYGGISLTRIPVPPAIWLFFTSVCVLLSFFGRSQWQRS